MINQLLNLASGSLRKSIPLALIAFAVVLSGSACQMTKKKDAAGVTATGTPGKVVPVMPPLQVVVPHSTDPKPLIAKPLTALGDNTDASFSPEGGKLLFLSRQRPAHRHAQVYELDLGKMIEHRVTFSDGNAYTPAWYPGGTSFLFGSATDENKEEIASIDRVMRVYNPEGVKKTGAGKDAALNSGELGLAEVYLQSLNGRESERLTKSPGFDAEAVSDAKGKHILFVSNRTGLPQLYLLNGRALVRVTSGKFVDRSPHFAPTGTAVLWSRQEAATAGGAHLYIANDLSFKNPTALTKGADASSDVTPAWHPLGDVILFSSNRGGPTYDLYTVDRAGQCVKRLTQMKQNLVQGSFSPDGKQIVFTGETASGHQIYEMDYRPPAECEPMPAATTPSPTGSPTPQTNLGSVPAPTPDVHDASKRSE